MEEDDYDEEVKSKKVRVSEIASSQLREPCIICHTEEISRLFSKYVYTAIYS